MGLTIHYKLRWKPPGPMPGDASARRLVEMARQRVERLKLGPVSPLCVADGTAFNGLEFVTLKRVRLADGS